MAIIPLVADVFMAPSDDKVKAIHSVHVPVDRVCVLIAMLFV